MKRRRDVVQADGVHPAEGNQIGRLRRLSRLRPAGAVPAGSAYPTHVTVGPNDGCWGCWRGDARE